MCGETFPWPRERRKGLLTLSLSLLPPSAKASATRSARGCRRTIETEHDAVPRSASVEERPRAEVPPARRRGPRPRAPHPQARSTGSAKPQFRSPKLRPAFAQGNRGWSASRHPLTRALPSSPRAPLCSASIHDAPRRVWPPHFSRPTLSTPPLSCAIECSGRGGFACRRLAPRSGSCGRNDCICQSLRFVRRPLLGSLQAGTRIAAASNGMIANLEHSASTERRQTVHPDPRGVVAGASLAIVERHGLRPTPLGIDEHRLREIAFACGYNVRRAARVLGISIRHLQRWFNAHLASTPGAWLAEERLQHARQLLPSSRSVKEVAYTLGFNHVSHFSRDFKRRFGHSPSVEMERPRRVLHTGVARALVQE